MSRNIFGAAPADCSWPSDWSTIRVVAEKIGDRVRRARLAKEVRDGRKIPQVEIQAAAEMPTGSVSRLEAGKSENVTVGTLIRLASVLECDFEWLARGVGSMAPASASADDRYPARANALAAARLLEIDPRAIRMVSTLRMHGREGADRQLSAMEWFQEIQHAAWAVDRGLNATSSEFKSVAAELKPKGKRGKRAK